MRLVVVVLVLAVAVAAVWLFVSIGRQLRGAAAAVALSEPWESHLRRAVAARERFSGVLGDTPAGPLRDRLVELAGHVDAATAESARVARIGSAMDGAGEVEAVAAARLGRLVESLEDAARIAARLSVGSTIADPAQLTGELDALAAALDEIRRTELGGPGGAGPEGPAPPSA